MSSNGHVGSNPTLSANSLALARSLASRLASGFAPLARRSARIRVSGKPSVVDGSGGLRASRGSRRDSARIRDLSATSSLRSVVAARVVFRLRAIRSRSSRSARIPDSDNPAHARSWRFGWSSGFDRLAWLACLERARIRASRKIALGSNPVDTMRSRRSLGERGPTPPSPRTSPSVMIPACLGYCFLSRLL